MKVKELIELLQQVDPDTPVFLECGGDCSGFIDLVDVKEDTFCLNCNPSRSYYGGNHLLESDAKRILNNSYSLLADEDKATLNKAIRVKGIYF